MDINNIDHLLEALYRTDVPHGTVMETRRRDEEHLFNWLDAATPAWLAENADKIILTCASRMAIRYTARQENEFISNHGYTGDGPIARGIISKDTTQEAEKHTAFYLKTKARVEKLARLDSINRRSQLVVLRFPTKEPMRQPESGQAGIAEKVRDPVEVYELMRRSRIAGNSSCITAGPGDYYRDWLDNGSHAELEESTDTILFCGAARMAIRASVRLEKAWRQDRTVNNDWPRYTTDILSDLREERDRAVDSYLKLREAQAKFAHNQGIIARSEIATKITKPKRLQTKKKGTKTA